jgi:hypothetical protein
MNPELEMSIHCYRAWDQRGRGTQEEAQAFLDGWKAAQRRIIEVVKELHHPGKMLGNGGVLCAAVDSAREEGR